MKSGERRKRARASEAERKRAEGPVRFRIEGEVSTRAVVLHPEFRKGPADGRSARSRLDEAIGLARAIDLEISDARVVNVDRIDPATALGPGQVRQVGDRVEAHAADLVIFNGALSPGQQRNLELKLGAKVLDRTGLILEIFGRRARTREGRLQVDLAHLSYQKSRLVRSWTHLERQRGGGGFMGGPGERQIESDRRLLRERIAGLQRRLRTVKNTRGLQRKARKRAPSPVVALVGYTNAGKSTLFNRLAGANAEARNLLFATLDPTMRRLTLPHGREVVLSDTVGFISDLPTELVAAFRATLEEVIEADLIVHVRDGSHLESEAQAGDVIEILEALGVNETEREERLIEVWNKSDLLDDDARESLGMKAGRRDDAVLTSAASGQGTERLLELIERRLATRRGTYSIVVEPENGAGLPWVYRVGEVLDRKQLENGAVRLTARLPAPSLHEGEMRFGLDIREQAKFDDMHAAE